MPVDLEKALHPSYTDMAPDWLKCRRVIGGRESEVKAPDFREIAIPKLDGHLDPKGAKFYDSYVARADWFPAASRTAGGLYGALTHKPPSLVYEPAGLETNDRVSAFLKDVTGSGQSWESFLDAIEDELLRVYRGGILVDYTEGPAPEGPAALVPTKDRRPTIRWYPAEAIEDWEYRTLAGERVLVYVKLREERVTRNENDERSEEAIYRKLDVAGGYYRQRVFAKAKKGVKGVAEGAWYQEGDEIVPRLAGKPLSRLPFVMVPQPTATAEILPPWLLPLVEKNLDHLQHSADHKNALRQAGSPQHILSGEGIAAKHRDKDGTPVTVEDKKLVLGAAHIWTYPGPVQAQTLTISAEAVAAIEAALTRCEAQLVILGARILAAERPAESGVAKEIDSRRDSSMLTRIATEAGEALAAALKLALLWLDQKNGTITVKPNLDFFTAKMSPDEVAMWDTLESRGFVAVSDVRRALREGELLPVDRTDEMIDDDIDKRPPPGVTDRNATDRNMEPMHGQENPQGHAQEGPPDRPGNPPPR